MNYFILLRTICLTVLMTPSNESINKDRSIVIIGSDKSISSQVLYIIESENSISGRYFHTLDSCKSDSAGNFSFHFEAGESSFYQIRNSDNRHVYYGKNLFLGPGDSLLIGKWKSEIILEGNAGKLNQFQWDLPSLILNDPVIKKISGSRDTWKLEHEEFALYADKLKQTQIQYYDRFSNEIKVPDVYKNYIHAKIYCEWVNDYWNYLEYHNNYAHDEWGYLPIDSVNTEFLTRWNPDTSFHYLSSYSDCIQGYVNHLYQDQTKDLADTVKWETEFPDKFSIITKNFHGINRDIALVGQVDKFWYYLMATDDFYRQAKEVVTFFKKNYQSEDYYAYFINQYEDYLNISPGKPAPDFTFPDTSDNLVSLSDFIGKVVYVDFWGTWCGPCLASIPKLVGLHEKLKDRDDIVFLNVALEYDDEDIKRWRKFLENRNYPGIHVVAEKQFLNEQLKPYKLRAAPTYTLIDKNGDIAITSADRPDKIYDDIIELIDK